MNAFIHTFSAVIYLTKLQFDSMSRTYDNEVDSNNKIWFYNSAEKNWFSVNTRTEVSYGGGLYTFYRKAVS